MAVGIVLQGSPALGVLPSADGAKATEASTPASPTPEELLATAKSQYASGDGEAALRSLQRCYEVSHSTNVLFNLAQLHRELSHCEAALEHYQRYLDAAPNGERAGDARRYADSLRQHCPPTSDAGKTPAPTQQPLAQQPLAQQPLAQQPLAQQPLAQQPLAQQPLAQQPLAQQPLAQQHASTPRRRYWNGVGWVAIGTGAAAVATAVYFSVETRQDKRDFEKLENEAAMSPKPDKAAIQEALDDFYRDRALAYAFATVGALAVGTGVCAWVFGASKERSETTAWSLTLSLKVLRADLGIQF